MINNYVPSQRRTVIEYDLRFDDGYGNGFAFPCDENGNLYNDMHSCAIENYKWCLENPDKFVRFNKVVKNTYTVKDPAHGICHCGSEVYLCDGYYGACQCDECGQWYNLSGQELRPPEEWEENLDNDW